MLQTTFSTMQAEGWLSLVFILFGFLLMVFDVVGGERAAACTFRWRPAAPRWVAAAVSPTPAPVPAALPPAADLVMNMVLALMVIFKARAGGPAAAGSGPACRRSQTENPPTAAQPLPRPPRRSSPSKTRWWALATAAS